MPSQDLQDQKALADHIALCIASRTRPRLFCDLISAELGTNCYPHPLHSLLVDWMICCFKARRKCLIQAPPEHGKSTLIIPLLIYLSARYGTPDPLRVGIVSRDVDLATQHLHRLRLGLLSNARRIAFPHLAPDFERSHAATSKGEWSKEKLYTINNPSPAFQRYSLFGAADGHRLDLIWLDDCVTRECLYSQAERERTAAAIFSTFNNRLTGSGISIVTNNCWHKDDAIHQMAESDAYAALWIAYDGPERLTFRARNAPPSWSRGDSGQLPLWEKVWPESRLREKMAEPGGAWKRLFEGRAVPPDDVRFPSPETWARWQVHETPTAGQLFAFLDPAGGRNADKGDFAATVLLNKRPDGTADLLDCRVRRESPAEQVRACFAMAEKWRRLGFGQIQRFEVEMLPKEEGWIKPIFDSEREQRRLEGGDWQVPFKVRHPTEPKAARIERLSPPIENGWLRFPSDLEERMRLQPDWRRLVDQIAEWPHSDHDDAPDALAGCWVASDVGKRKPVENALAGIGVF